MGGQLSAIRKNCIETGIAGLDKLLDYSYPANSLVMLAGKCGTGKTVFTLQFIYHGATKRNEPGLYITFEEEPEELIEQAETFGWDLKSLVEKKIVSIIKPETVAYQSVMKIIEDEVDRLGVKRIVINSFSLMSSYFKDIYSTRKALSDLRRKFRALKCSGIIVSDIKEGEITYSHTGYEEFVVSGIILLDIEYDNKNACSHRTMFIRKLKSHCHPLEKIPFKITAKGIEVCLKKKKISLERI